MRLLIFGGVLLAFAPTARAQAVPLPAPIQPLAPYTSTQHIPDGPQWVVVYIGSTGCGFSRDSSLKEAVRRMKPLVTRQAVAANYAISLSGVALDWSPDSGFAYLKSLGAWDEVIAGNNWMNLGATHFVWQAPGGRPSIPQVLIIQRTVRPQDRSIEISADTRLRQIVGVDSIVAWVNAGAPVRQAP